uniref:Uncharacterized protein LOC104243338 n=1 Tax=Nicotiana sylvestris TaxID=4096 RepID=A0A1U7XXV9_NICSY
MICQYYDKPGHVVKQYRKLKNAFPWLASSSMVDSVDPKPMANVANATAMGNSNWLLDSGASHHITSDLENLSLHSDYTGDDVMIGDGNNLKVTHFGSSHLPTPKCPLYLSDVLCVPQIKKNLLSVYQLCKTNNVSVEFSPFSYVVKATQSCILIQLLSSSGSSYSTFFCYSLAQSTWSSVF